MPPRHSHVLLGVFATTALASSAIPRIKLDLVTGGLDSPTSLTHANDGTNRMFICQQPGKILILEDGALLPVPFIDLSGKIVPLRPAFDERGLLGLAFHPGFSTAGSPGLGRLYIFYSAVSPNAPGTPENPVDCRSTIAEFRISAADSNVVDPASERVLLSFDKPQFNHNGGQLEFGPDGLLYISTGDGGSSNDNNAGHTGGNSSRPADALGNSQDLTNLLGKILRIDPLGTDGPGGQYGIPANNPFVGAGGGVRAEIFCNGLRNPWRFCFDKRTGGTNRMFIADVGQGNFEEIDLGVSGGNYGWRNKEGSAVFAPDAPAGGPFIDPIAEYAHPTTPDTTLPKIGISVTGGYVYRGSAFPELAGKYLFGDWSTDGAPTAPPAGTMLGLEETSPDTFQLSVLDVVGGNPIATRILAFGEDEAGEIYVATQTTRAPGQLDPVTQGLAGALWKIVPAFEPITSILPASADNTIHSENTNSNGKGINIFSGRTASFTTPTFRRALIKFDLSAVPVATTAQGASVSLTMDKTIAGEVSTTLHRVTADWGEGTSDALGDEGMGAPPTAGGATWDHRRFPEDLWTNEGGDFVAAPSATLGVGGRERYTWTGPGLAADVNAWLTDPASNFGWLVRTDENVQPSAKRFNSREHPTAANRPSLSVTYLGLSHYESWRYNFFRAGQFVFDNIDNDGDALPNGIEYAWGFNPQFRSEFADGLSFGIENIAGANRLVVRFRRDPFARDLDYRLEISSNFTTWTTLVTILAGAAPAGPGFVSDQEIAGQAPFRRVTARDTAAASSNITRHVRLAVTRRE